MYSHPWKAFLDKRNDQSNFPPEVSDNPTNNPAQGEPSLNLLETRNTYTLSDMYACQHPMRLS